MKKFFLALFLLLTCVYTQPHVALATVVEDDSADRYTGNGSATAYVYNFKILDDDDIAVLVNGIAKVKGTDYSVSGVGNSNGGTVTFVTAPGSDLPVTLIRRQPLSQLSNFIANESYNPLKVMNALDRAAMIDQMLAERIARTPKVAASSTVVPTLCIGALKYLRWNAAATDLECVDGTTSPQTEISIAAAGIWTNTQYNTAAQIVINGADFSGLFSDNQGGNFTSDGLTVAIKTPSTATVYQSNAISGYNKCEDADTNCVGGYFSVHADVASANAFGLNVVHVAGDFAGIRLQSEMDFNVQRTDTAINGLTFQGVSTAQPTDATAIIVGVLGSGIGWVRGLAFTAASIAAGGAGIDFLPGSVPASSTAIQLGPVTTANNQPSQFINFVGKDAGGTNRIGTIRSDADGNLLLRPAQAATKGVTIQTPDGLTDFLNIGDSKIVAFPGGTNGVEISNASLEVNLLTTIIQASNGVNTLDLKRFTDTGPTGNFIRLRDAANANSLFNVDITGTITRVNNTATVSATKTVRAAGGAADCTLIYTGGVLTGGTC